MSGFDVLKGQKIRADCFNKSILSRKMFVDENKEKIMKTKITNGLPILFLPTHVQAISDFLGSNSPYPTKFLLIGTLPSGSKASVLLSNPPIYFDIYCRELVEKSAKDYCPGINFGDVTDIGNIVDKDFLRFCKESNKILASIKLLRRSYVCKKIYNIGAVDHNKHIGIRLWFSSIKDMREAHRQLLQISEFFVASNSNDSLNSAFITTNKYCGSWMVIKTYEHKKYYERNYPNVYTKAKHNFTCNFRDFVSPTENPEILCGMSLDELNSFQGKNLEITWDIETKQVKCDDEDAEDNTGSAILNKNNKIFNICMTISDTSQTNKVLLTIGLFRPKCEAYIRFDNQDFDIMCKTQKELLMTFAKIINYLQPEIMTTFNGCNFDLPLYLMQSRLEGIFEEVHCEASIMTMNSMKKLKVDSRGVMVNTSGYPLWNNVYTTSVVSGISHGEKKHMETRSFKLEKGLDLEFHYWNIGTIHLDLYMISKKKFPKAQYTGLSAMLKQNKLNIAKKDLEYHEIWRRWEISESMEALKDPQNIKLLAEIDEYCKMDCYCTYKLREKYMILEEKRSMCKYTHLPMEVVLYQADSIKVESGLGALYSADNYVYVASRVKSSNPGKHLHKYHVEPPALYNKGAIVEIWTAGKVYMQIEIDGKTYKKAAPAAALDVQSLYPNLIINYGLSLDAMRFTKPSNIDDFDEHYLPEMPKEFEEEMPDKKLWIRKHRGDVNNFAIVPKFLWGLFNDRIKIKKELAKTEDEKDKILEEIRSEFPKSEFAKQNPDLTGSDLDEKYQKFCKNKAGDRVLSLEARWQTLNAYQNTIKVLMNTVYGVTKFPSNIFYCFFIAHLVTKTGRELILHINNVIKQAGATVDYNDTDSAYYHHNAEFYLDIIKKRYVENAITELKYRKKMTYRCMKLNVSKQVLESHYKNKLAKIGVDLYDENNATAAEKRQKMGKYSSMQDTVNGAILKYTGYGYLRMVIEEVLFPVSFFAKKKYFGFNHGIGFREEITIDNLIIKGISYVTRQTSQIQKDFNKQIMLEMVTGLDSDCEEALMRTTIEFYNSDYDVSKYLISFTNKLTTNNPRVRPFVQRMALLAREYPDLAHLYRVPDPLEVFKYAIVRKNVTRTLRGNMKKFRKTDSAEYEQVIKYFGYEIDKDHYLMALVSTFAQFLTYKDFPFREEGMLIKDYKKKIETKYVKPMFKKISEGNPYNIQKSLEDKQIGLIYASFKNNFEVYVETYYPEIRSILMNFYKSNKKDAFRFMMTGAKNIATKKIDTNIDPKIIRKFMNPTKDEIAADKLAGRSSRVVKRALFMNGDELRHLECVVLEAYKPHIINIELKMEQAVYDYIRSCGNDKTPNYLEIPKIITQEEVELIIEFDQNLRKYITYMQYWNAHLMSDIIV